MHRQSSLSVPGVAAVVNQYRFLDGNRLTRRRDGS
jgi:hypothetical protein